MKRGRRLAGGSGLTAGAPDLAGEIHDYTTDPETRLRRSPAAGTPRGAKHPAPGTRANAGDYARVRATRRYSQSERWIRDSKKQIPSCRPS